MAKLKTDWILFGAILAMTAFGLVVLVDLLQKRGREP